MLPPDEVPVDQSDYNQKLFIVVRNTKSTANN